VLIEATEYDNRAYQDGHEQSCQPHHGVRRQYGPSSSLGSARHYLIVVGCGRQAQYTFQDTLRRQFLQFGTNHRQQGFECG
jgi:hypothetical protein